MPFELIKPDTRIDFLGKWRLCAAISIALLLVAAVAVPLRGVRLGIDFAGGVEMQVHFTEGLQGSDEGTIRAAVRAVEGVEEAQVVRYGAPENDEYLIRIPAVEGAEEAVASGEVPTEGAIEAGPADDVVEAIRTALTQAVGPLEVDRIEAVGPRVGAELRRDGLTALAVAALLILVYVGFRFSLRFAPGAVVALLHDVLITAGVFVVLGMEFDLRVLAALLAIIGYSLNDTIIVYDRIRENLQLYTTLDLPEVLNRSVNQTLGRTLLTSGTTLAAVLALLVLGGEVIRPFAVAMTIGILIGTYSSIYVAAPTLLFLVRRFGTGEEGGGRPTGAASEGPREARRKSARPRPQSGGKRRKQAARGGARSRS